LQTKNEHVRVFAPAKINLFLHVGQKRPDGFHELESLVAFARTGDELCLAPADGISLEIDGPFAGGLSAGPDNLVLKAARALAAAGACAEGARIRLTKNLPVASGIGGGSSDAAAVLRGLNALWELNRPPEFLCEIGSAIGSDVPVCVEPVASWMAGRGEKVTALAGIPAVPMVLVNPGVPVPTGTVFRALNDRRGTGLSPPPAMESIEALVSYLELTGNDLELPARAIAPAVGEALDALAAEDGVFFARMSGSGATCFALVETAEAAQTAAAALRAAHPSWWCAVG
jgi:4-diphosphocytidyl-2-C-methyl-D-erythritol kinase